MMPSQKELTEAADPFAGASEVLAAIRAALPAP
jgi:hypothetical protein